MGVGGIGMQPNGPRIFEAETHEIRSEMLCGLGFRVSGVGLRA